jgi:ABC-type Fe3+ transport system substrate-binding protein
MNDPAAPRLTIFGKLAIAALIGGSLWLAWSYFTRGALPWKSAARPADSGTVAPGGPARPVPAGAVTFGVAYGTEKKAWLEWAAAEWAKTDAGARMVPDLIPMGSLEGAQAIVAGDKRIHVWSPASSAYEDVFLQEWSVKQSGKPILRKENLALTPMVFVFWEARHDAFLKKYKKVRFDTIRQALAEKSGWQGIAQKPEWGLFKFGHTNPNQSNSGLLTLVCMAYEFHAKSKGLELADVLDPKFQEWFESIEKAASGLANSTGNMMKEMVLKGPSSFDALFVYENVAIDYLKGAEGRWGSLRIAYPERNFWNENPYYVLDAPWSSPDQRKAASQFLDFLLSERVQKQALEHGFRPGNVAVPVKTPESPFSRYAANGVQIDLETVTETPRAEVINNLLASWQRRAGTR